MKAKNNLKLVYSDRYHVDIGPHVFPTEKYRLVKDRLASEDGLGEEYFISPGIPCDEDVFAVHTEEYIHKLKNAGLSSYEIQLMELPYSKGLIEASLLCVGGTILACRQAMKEGTGVHIGGGFHHAFPDHGEGFCVLNDIACGIRAAQKYDAAGKVLVVDCDLHQGNGTAFIFRDDDSVFTFSIHQENNYPYLKPPGSMDIGLEDGAGDGEYINSLEKNIPCIIKSFGPELMVYVAGADPYRKDALGGLALTLEGLKKRDELVIGLARAGKIPYAVVLAGGYAEDVDDTVTIHYNTIKTAIGR
jgi:acetoin utilization deacetylase AcuC-like enzyme